MKIELRIGYWSQSVAVFDPQKVLFRARSNFSNFRSDFQDTSLKELESARLFASKGGNTTQLAKLVDSTRERVERIGPIYEFDVTSKRGSRCHGFASRYVVLFEIANPIAEEELELVAFLLSLKLGSLRSDTKTQIFSEPDVNEPGYWMDIPQKQLEDQGLP